MATSNALGRLTLNLDVGTGDFEMGLRRAMDNARRSSNEIRRAFDGIGSGNVGGNGVSNFVERSSGELDTLRSKISGVGLALGSMFSVGKLIEMADGYTQMAARIRNATKDASEYAMVQERILETANQTFRPLAEAQEVYLSLAGGMKSLGKTTMDTLNLVDSLSYSFTHNATRSDQAQSAMDSLAKAMATGKVSGDQWISITTAADNIIADLARTTGKTELEIRSLGASGKIALNDLLNAFILTRDANKELANAMENSLADGFRALNNAITVYVGQANQSTSATGILAGGLGVLAENLDTVVDVAMIAGLTLLTKKLLEQAVAVKGAIAASAARRAALAAEVAAQQQAMAVEVSRARRAQAQALTDLNTARNQSTVARTLAERQAATMRLTQAEIAYALANNRTNATLQAQKILEAELLAAQSLRARALALVGGPIGAITLAVMGVAAAWTYFSNKAEEANKKLEEQGRVAKKTREELEQLTGIDRATAINDLTASFNAQNKALDESGKAVNNVLFAIRAASVENERARKITEDARNGVISYTDAIKLLNSENISPDLYNKLKEQSAQYEVNRAKAQENATAQEAFGIKVTLAGNAAENAAAKIRDKAAATRDDADASESAAKANDEYNQSLKQRIWDQQFINQLVINHGKSLKEATTLNEIYRANEKAGIRGVTEEQKELAKTLAVEEDRIANRDRAVQEAKRKSEEAAREAKRQADQQAREAKRQADERAREQEKLEEELKNIREKVTKDFMTEERRLEVEHQEYVADIRRAYGYGSSYESMARERYAKEREIAKQTFQNSLGDWKRTEDEKLRISTQNSINSVTLDNKLSDSQKLLRIADIQAQAEYEQAAIKLNREYAIREAYAFRYSDRENLIDHYDFQRKLIEQTYQFDTERREAELAKLGDDLSKELEELNERKKQTRLDLMADLGISNPYAEAEDQYKEMRKALDKARADEAISEQEYREMQLVNDQLFLTAKAALWTEAYSDIFGSMADIMGTAFGKESAHYKAAFTIQKAFAIAQSAIAIQQALAQSMAMPYPANLAAYATVAAQTASIISNIQAVALEGFANGGYTGDGGKFDVAGLVHKGEVVFSQDDVRNLGGVANVEAIRTGQAHASSVGATSQPVVNLTNVNNLDPRTFLAVMGTREGQRVIQNYITENPSVIQQAVGG